MITPVTLSKNLFLGAAYQAEVENLAAISAIQRYFSRDQHVPLASRRLIAHQKLLELNLSCSTVKHLLAEWDAALRPSDPAPLCAEEIVAILMEAQADLKPYLPVRPEPVLIGEALQKAGLLSPAQVEVVLKDQADGTALRFGEILALRGWLNAATVEFFAERLPCLAATEVRSPIGQYLKQAGLLDEQQVEFILDEQRYLKQRFGELAVGKGWVKQETLDVLLASLATSVQTHGMFPSA